MSTSKIFISQKFRTGSIFKNIINVVRNCFGLILVATALVDLLSYLLNRAKKGSKAWGILAFLLVVVATPIYIAITAVTKVTMGSDTSKMVDNAFYLRSICTALSAVIKAGLIAVMIVVPVAGMVLISSGAMLTVQGNAVLQGIAYLFTYVTYSNLYFIIIPSILAVLYTFKTVGSFRLRIQNKEKKIKALYEEKRKLEGECQALSYLLKQMLDQKESDNEYKDSIKITIDNNRTTFEKAERKIQSRLDELTKLRDKIEKKTVENVIEHIKSIDMRDDIEMNDELDKTIIHYNKKINKFELDRYEYKEKHLKLMKLGQYDGILEEEDRMIFDNFASEVKEQYGLTIRRCHDIHTTNDRVLDQIGEINKQTQEIEKLNNEKEQEIANLKSEKEQAIAELNKKIKELNNEKEQAIAELNNEKIAELKQEIENKTQEIKKLNKEIEELRSNKEQAIEELEQQILELNNEKTEELKKQQKNEKLEQQILELNTNTIKELKEEIEKLNNDKETQKQANEKLKQEIKNQKMIEENIKNKKELVYTTVEYLNAILVTLNSELGIQDKNLKLLDDIKSHQMQVTNQLTKLCKILVDKEELTIKDEDSHLSSYLASAENAKKEALKTLENNNISFNFETFKQKAK